jgi:hypothetical protein
MKRLHTTSVVWEGAWNWVRSPTSTSVEIASSSRLSRGKAKKRLDVDLGIGIVDASQNKFPHAVLSALYHMYQATDKPPSFRRLKVSDFIVDRKPHDVLTHTRKSGKHRIVGITHQILPF